MSGLQALQSVRKRKIIAQPNSPWAGHHLAWTCQATSSSKGELESHLAQASRP